MGRNINDIIRKAEMLKYGGGGRTGNSRDYSTEGGFNLVSGKMSDAHPERPHVFRGREPMREEPVCREKPACTAKLEGREEQRKRTLLDFIKFLENHGKLEEVNLELRGGFIKFAELFVGNLKGFDSTYETEERITRFLAVREGSRERSVYERDKYAWVSRATDYEGKPESFIKLWRNVRDGKLKLHLRLAVKDEGEFGAAIVHVEGREYNAHGRELADLVKFIHEQGFAGRDEVFDLRWRHGKAVIFIGEFDGDRRKLAQMLAARFGKEMTGRYSGFERKYDWVSKGSTPENVGSCMKSWFRGGFGTGEKMRLRLEIHLSISPQEYMKADEFFRDIRGMYALKDDPKKRTPQGYLKMLVEAGRIDDFAGIKLLIERKGEGYAVTLGWTEKRGGWIGDEEDNYFMPRFGKMGTFDADMRGISAYRYVWCGEGVEETGTGHEPASYLKRERIVRDGEHKQVTTLGLSGLTKGEAGELEMYVRKLKGEPLFEWRQ